MVKLHWTDMFEKKMSKLDSATREKVEKQIRKILKNPSAGKPMRYGRQGTRELYVQSLRLSYTYNPVIESVLIVNLYHKREQ